MSEALNQGAGQAPSTPAPVSAPQATPASAPASSPASTGAQSPASTTSSTPGEGQVVTPPAYAPNFKFKVHNQEMEIPEWARSSIKDAATEKQAKEIWEKAHGLEVVKPKLERTRMELEGIRKEHAPLKKSMEFYSSCLAKGDFDTFFKTAQVPLEKIYAWVHQRLQEMDLPEPVRQSIEQAREAKMQNYFLQNQVNDSQNQNQTYAEQVKSQQLSAELEKPEVASLIKDYDTRAQKPGAFMEKVIRYAATIETLQHKELSAEEAVNAVLAEVKPFLQSSQAPAPVIPQNNPQQGIGQGGGQQAPLPVIPNVGGNGSSSPTKKLPRNIEDIKRIAKTM